MTGRPQLTRRQFAILAGLAAGLTQAQLATELHLSRTTIKGHVARLLALLGATTVAHAVDRAWRAGILRPETAELRERPSPAPFTRDAPDVIARRQDQLVDALRGGLIPKAGPR